MRFAAPEPDCTRCARLADFRRANRQRHPDFHNAPVPSFGELDARLLVVGLAPGLKGANRTGRPFTGDAAGELLYSTLRDYDLATGAYTARTTDGFALVGCRVTNAVRCVPPGNKPETTEIAACNGFLTAEIAAMPKLRAILALGQIAHGAVLRALGLRASAHRFAHGAEHALPGGMALLDSFHCSRLNTNTGRLTPAMFETIVERARDLIAR